MRRRNLLGAGGKLTLSQTSNTVSGASDYAYVYVYWNDVALKESDVVVLSDQSWATPTWYASSGYFRLRYESNGDLNNSRSATITVTYKGVNATYTLTQNKGTWSVYPQGLSFHLYPSSQTFRLELNGSAYSGTDYTVSESLSWVTTSTSGGTITVTVTENTGSSSREGDITLTFKGTTQTITVSQHGRSQMLGVRFANGSTYTYPNWPSGGTPIGIVIPGISACASLTNMSYNNPNNGSHTIQYQSIVWGGYGYDVAGLTNYSSGDAARSDMNGQSNTATILALDNSSSTAWKTASKISNTGNNQYVHPAAQCCWRYYTAGTSQGSWYLPSLGEMLALDSVYMQFGCTCEVLNYVYGSGTAYNLNVGHDYHTSTENNSNDFFSKYIGYGNYVRRKDDYCEARAFLKI